MRIIFFALLFCNSLQAGWFNFLQNLVRPTVFSQSDYAARSTGMTAIYDPKGISWLDLASLLEDLLEIDGLTPEASQVLRAITDGRSVYVHLDTSPSALVELQKAVRQVFESSYINDEQKKLVKASVVSLLDCFCRQNMCVNWPRQTSLFVDAAIFESMLHEVFSQSHVFNQEHGRQLLRCFLYQVALSLKIAREQKFSWQQALRKLADDVRACGVLIGASTMPIVSDFENAVQCEENLTKVLNLHVYSLFQHVNDSVLC